MSCNALEERNAIVTGGAQGLGEYLCHRLAQEGAKKLAEGAISLEEYLRVL